MEASVVALRVSSDNVMFYCYGIKGYQDTLFTHLSANSTTIHYETIDFIFNNAPTVIQNCDIFVLSPNAPPSQHDHCPRTPRPQREHQHFHPQLPRKGLKPPIPRSRHTWEDSGENTLGQFFLRFS
uniref:Pectinesterase catalytic domain-containing protein n=1 Tax=Cannabis sativa TaxID=3483 RepID=A0A803NVD8_CANSA